MILRRVCSERLNGTKKTLSNITLENISKYMDSDKNMDKALKQTGILDPSRQVELIRTTIRNLDMDLSGLTVITEAASGPYVVTPVIACMAGADRVIALSDDSPYATFEQVTTQTRAFEKFCGFDVKIEILRNDTSEVFSEADIVTNLGFVRPLNSKRICRMKSGSALSLMCETWELREGDVDIDACREAGVHLVATNEDFPTVDVFNYSGWLILKMMFMAQIEIHKSSVLVISSDKFGTVIERRLSENAISVKLRKQASLDDLADIDVIVVADYKREEIIIGKDGDISVEQLTKNCPGVSIIQLAGRIDNEGLAERGVHVYPEGNLPAVRMSRTLAFLGPRPVIELHAAGLKTGELAVRYANDPQGLSDSRYYSLLQRIV